MKAIKFLLIMVAALVALAWGFRQSIQQKPHDHAQEAADKDIYYCPMHPQIQRDQPGNCPICGMKLVKKAAPEEIMTDMSLPDHAAATLTRPQTQLIGIKTAEVMKRPLIKTVRAPGEMAHGIDLYKVQSEFIDAYVEFINVYRDYKRFSQSRRTWETHRDLQVKMFEAEHKLLMLGLDHHQVDALRHINRAQIWNQPELMFFNNGKEYWVYAQIFEDDRGYVDIAQEATIELPAYRETFEGVVRSVGGAVDPMTRTIRVLIEPKKDQSDLPVGMLANVLIKAELGSQLSIPEQAVMDTGVRKIVYVVKENGVYEPREIEVGAHADGYWAVAKGLAEGEKVVVDGNFLLDSESRLQAALGRSSESEVAPKGHTHGQ